MFAYTCYTNSLMLLHVFLFSLWLHFNSLNFYLDHTNLNTGNVTSPPSHPLELRLTMLLFDFLFWFNTFEWLTLLITAVAGETLLFNHSCCPSFLLSSMFSQWCFYNILLMLFLASIIYQIILFLLITRDSEFFPIRPSTHQWKRSLRHFCILDDLTFTCTSYFCLSAC